MSPGPSVPLAGKLALLLRREAAKTGGRIPSVRAVAAATAERPGAKPVMTYQVVNDLLNGVKSNPSTAQLIGLARALNCPPPYLLPGYDGLTSLSVYESQQHARAALRLIHDLGETGAAELLEAAREIRLRHGYADLTIPEVPPQLPLPPEPPRPGRRRRLDVSEAARTAIADPEGG